LYIKTNGVALKIETVTGPHVTAVTRGEWNVNVFKNWV